jgi:uncharacterized protein YdhG (YjbR/CyaY superfamily)
MLIDDYISLFPEHVQEILQKVRLAARSAAPGAKEIISYRMPALKQHGVLVYFAAFKHHIGFYPPIRGDARLEKAAAPYAGEKGNLRFPLDKPIPYRLITRLTRLRAAGRREGRIAAQAGSRVAGRPGSRFDPGPYSTFMFRVLTTSPQRLPSSTR